MAKIALIAAAFGAAGDAQVQAIKLQKDAVEEPETDIYTPKTLNGWQMEQFEKKKQFVQANPDTVFGGGKVGFANERGSLVEGSHEGDREP